jgi:hypothetical protein
MCFSYYGESRFKKLHFRKSGCFLYVIDMYSLSVSTAFVCFMQVFVFNHVFLLLACFYVSVLGF